MAVPGEIIRNRPEILRIASRHGAGNIRVFGSLVRGEQRPDSDIDLLIDVVGPTTPWFPGGLAADLEELLSRRVQIVIGRSLSPLIRDRVLEEAVLL